MIDPLKIPNSSKQSPSLFTFCICLLFPSLVGQILAWDFAGYMDKCTDELLFLHFSFSD